MRTMAFVVCGLLLLVAVGSADATCRTVRSRVVVQRVKVAQFIAVPVAVPSYAVGYAPQSSGDINKLREEIRQLRELIESGLPKKLPAGASPWVKVFVNRCASCHDTTTARAKGNNVVLTDGGQVTVNNSHLALKVVTQVVTGKMPKGGKMKDEEVDAIIEWAEGLK